MTESPRGEEGVTLIELLVTVMILSIVSLMLFTFMDGVTRVTARTDRHVQAEQEGQLALRKMTEEIRAANPILNAGGCSAGFGDCLQFDIPRGTNFAQACVRRTVAYKLNRTSRLITRESTDWVWNAGTSSCLATNVSSRTFVESAVFPSTTALFQYTNADGATLSPTADAAKIPLPPNQTGTAAVKVNLVIKYQARNTPDLVLSSNAVLRNNR